jgi:hypothetical protein
MDVTSRGKTNTPPRILEYRKQVKIGSAFIKYLSYFLLLIFLRTLAAYFFMEQDSKATGGMLEGVIATGVAWFIIYLEYLLLFRPLAISKIQVYEDRIFLRRGKKEITIPFDDVVEIKSAVNKNVGGSFKLILKNKKKYRFSIVLERVDYILDAVVKYNPKLMGEDKYLKLRKHLVLSDHRLGRFYDMFSKKYRLMTFAHCVFLPMVFFAMLYVKQSDQFIIHSPFLYFMKIGGWSLIYMVVLGQIFTLIMSIINDKHTMHRMEENIDNKGRDTEYESKIYKKLFPAYLMLLLAFFGGIYQTNLNTLGTTSLAKGAKDLNIKAGERLWYDSRYNCTDCNHKLRPNDLVMTSAGIGKIVALPNNTVAVNVNKKDKDKKGRSIASVEEKQVPQKSIAIKTANGKTILIQNKHIKGKVFKEIPHFK